MRNTNKRSEGYKTRAERKKEKKELKRKSKMEKKFLIGIYDNYRNNCLLNDSLDKVSCKLIGTYSTEPIYDMYELKDDNNCIVKVNGDTSIKVEVWEVNDVILDKIERTYNYYPAFAEYPQDYVKEEEVLSPFGKTIMYFTNIFQSKEDLIINGDWVEHLNYKRIMGDKKLVL